MARSVIKETTNGLSLNWPLNEVTTLFNEKKKKKNPQMAYAERH